jgi:hypothetical protein
VVGVAWEDARNGNPDIAYRRSSNGGASFAPLTFLVQAPSDDTRPALAMSGGVALVAWEDTRNKNKDIAYRRSSDGGVSWSTQAFLVRSNLDEREPALDLDGSRALLTWMDQRHGSDDLAYRSSADAGASWAGLTFLVRSQDRESHPTVAVDGMNVLVGWVDERFGNQDLAFRRSTDGGASFARLTFLVKAPTDDAQIVMDLSGENGVLAWVDRRSANRNISFRHSSDAGLNWGSTARLVSAPSGEALPACALAAGVATCAWDDTREREPLAHARESVSGGAAWGTRFELDEPN